VDFRTTTAREIGAQVRGKEVSAREVISGALDRIDKLDPTYNAWVAVDGERALAAARDIDERVARGEAVGPLAGVPIGVKDLEDAAGFTTTHGSAAFADHPPATADSILVTRLRAAGCVVIGKTNTPELGWTSQTTNATFGTTHNPWNPDHTPGGSSGGSAAALAAGMVPLATGSDGGGSIRIPSALCGLSGFKPSLGRIPAGGAHAPDWHHLSTRGPMARSVQDIAFALDAVIGPDPSDLRSLPMPEASWMGAVEEPHVPHRVAWSPTLGYAPVDSEVLAICERAVRALEDAGAEIVEVPRVFETDPVGPWLTMASIYNLRTMEPHRGTEVWDRMDPGLVAQLDYAAGRSATDLVRAEDQCHELNLRLVELFHEVRLLVCPVTAATAPRCGEPGLIDGAPDVNWVRFTYGFNMTRSPAGTVCAGTTEAGLPVGLQLVGPQHGDLVVLRAMAALEAALGFDALAPC